MKRKLIILLISLFIPLNTLAYSKFIIPGGENIGIEVKNNGVLIIGFYKINESYNKNGLKIGDTILKVNDKNITTIEELVNTIDEKQKDGKVNITILRDNKEKNIEFELIEDNNRYKTGLYVKDSITGIGTLTYIDPSTHIYGALGHEIIESNSLKKIEVRTGSIFESNITGIDKSERGVAGTKNAKFNFKNIYGTINKNTGSGIYGEYKVNFPEKELLEVATNEEIKTGEAKILTVLKNNKVEEFNINILKIDSTTKIKNIYFEITDKNLINQTGGIVQGMSGSPIIQNNKIIGAVTHVIINEPVTGYGIFITTMLETGEAN